MSSSTTSYGSSFSGKGGGAGQGTGGGGKSSGGGKSIASTNAATLGNYHWNVEDTSAPLSVNDCGAAGSAVVIEAQDGYGGRNVSCGRYHIHFHGNSMKVDVIRYKGAQADQDLNIIKFKGGHHLERHNLKKLKDACIAMGYAQYGLFLEALRAAVSNSDAELH